MLSYLKLRRLPLSLENKELGFSFRSLQGKDLGKIKRRFPEDFEKIKKMFPLVEAELKRGEFYAPDLSDGTDQEKPDQAG